MANPDVVIVGAGAAGIGAALEFRERGIPCLVLEAAGRVGGRAHTDRHSLPHPWDRGCHWLHCADVNPLTAWADRLGAEYVRQKWVNHAMVWSGGRWLEDSRRDAARARVSAAFDEVYAAAQRGEDVPITKAVPEVARRDSSARNILQLMCSEDPEHVSTLGYGDYDDTEVNWPVATGYGDLFERMAVGLVVRLGTRVTRVEQGAGRVRLETSGGTLEARAAIVTTSTNVLRSGAIAFGPGPARDLLDLVEDVPCGSYEKVAIALRRRLVEDPGKLFCMIEPGEGATPQNFQFAPNQRPMMFAHLGGSLARELAAAGETAMADHAVGRLAMAFGSDIRREVVKVAVTSWQDDPLVLGAYSYARAGTACRRHEMIAADTGNVAFAGEAFSRQWQATAHGAYLSGRDVAARVAEGLGKG